MMNVYPHAIWGRSAGERLPLVLALACCAARSTSAAPATPGSASTEGPPQSNDGAQLAEAAAVGQRPATAATVNAGQYPRNPMIDDLEDGNAEITPAEGRDGSWYTLRGRGGLAARARRWQPLRPGGNPEPPARPGQRELAAVWPMAAFGRGSDCV